MSASCRFCGHKSYGYDGHECDGIIQSRELAVIKAAVLHIKELWADDTVICEPWVYDEAIKKLTELI